ncbi:hypothetical protein N9A94_01765 [Akkermansiaceae bacterium]|nr:hypothetical protein [Akkermansiaceae bacterium]MDB4544757.1 hypothetical protein [Akkermansiaceae bacterium]
MNAFSEYRVQSVISALQALLIIFSTFHIWLDSKLLLTSMGIRTSLEGFPLFVHHSGIFFLLIPIAWVFATIKLERNHLKNWSVGHTLLSGIILIGLIVIFYAKVRHSTIEGHLRMIPLVSQIQLKI